MEARTGPEELLRSPIIPDPGGPPQSLLPQNRGSLLKGAARHQGCDPARPRACLRPHRPRVRPRRPLGLRGQAPTAEKANLGSDDGRLEGDRPGRRGPWPRLVTWKSGDLEEKARR